MLIGNETAQYQQYETSSKDLKPEKKVAKNQGGLSRALEEIATEATTFLNGCYFADDVYSYLCAAQYWSEEQIADLFVDQEQPLVKASSNFVFSLLDAEFIRRHDREFYARNEGSIISITNQLSWLEEAPANHKEMYDVAMEIQVAKYIEDFEEFKKQNISPLDFFGGRIYVPPVSLDFERNLLEEVHEKPANRRQSEIDQQIMILTEKYDANQSNIVMEYLSTLEVYLRLGTTRATHKEIREFEKHLTLIKSRASDAPKFEIAKLARIQCELNPEVFFAHQKHSVKYYQKTIQQLAEYLDEEPSLQPEAVIH